LTVLPTTLATGIELQVLDRKGQPVPGVRADVQEAIVRQGVSRTWAQLGSDSGRVAAPGLPDEQAISLTILKGGFAPAVLRGRPSGLPRAVVLQDGAEISGRLINRERRPLAGASVQAEAWAAPNLPKLLMVMVKSVADGSFRLRGLPFGHLILTFHAAGYAPQAEAVDLAVGSAVNLGARVLQRGQSLAVHVSDENDSAVADAAIESGGRPRGKSDSAGNVVLADVAAAPLEVRGNAPGHLPGSVRAQPPFPEVIELHLPRAFTVRGRFVDSAGRPVPDGSVRIEMASCHTEEPLRQDGSFEEDIPSATAAQLAIHSTSAGELRMRLEPGRPGEVRDLGDLAAPDGLAVTGEVVDTRDGSPVAGARVWVPRQGPEGPNIAWANRDLLESSTGEDGRFRVAGLVAGPATLRVEAAGYARKTFDVQVADSASGGTSTDAGVIDIGSGASLRIHVNASRDRADIEGAEARVDLRRHWLDLDMLTAEVWNGEAVIPNVPAGAATVSVLAGRKLLCEKQVDVPGDGSQIEVECQKGSMIVAGQVLVGGARASTGMLTWQTPQAGNAGKQQSQIINSVSPGGLREQQVFGAGRPQVDVAVAADGSFQTDDLASGSWQVVYLPMAGSATGALVVQIPELDRFDTALTFGGTSISGTVTNHDGSPGAGARVRELGTGALAFAGADGSFALFGLAPGKVSLQARLDDLVSPVAVVELSAERPLDSISLVLGPRDKTEISVAVLNPDGAPVAGAVIFVEEDGKGIRLLTTGTDGTAKAALEPPFPLRLRVATLANGSWSFGNWVSPDQASQGLTLQVGSTGSLLVLSGKQGGPLRLASDGGWDISWLLRLLGSDATLTPPAPFQIKGLPPGQYLVTLESTTITATVSPGTISQAALK
jgi:hypothetical protein